MYYLPNKIKRPKNIILKPKMEIQGSICIDSENNYFWTILNIYKPKILIKESTNYIYHEIKYFLVFGNVDKFNVKTEPNFPNV